MFHVLEDYVNPSLALFSSALFYSIMHELGRLNNIYSVVFAE